MANKMLKRVRTAQQKAATKRWQAAGAAKRKAAAPGNRKISAMISGNERLKSEVAKIVVQLRTGRKGTPFHKAKTKQLNKLMKGVRGFNRKGVY